MVIMMNNNDNNDDNEDTIIIIIILWLKNFELRIIRELRKNSLPYIINNWRKRKYKKIQNIVSKENNKKVLNDC